MKKCFVLFLTAVVLLLNACGNSSDTPAETGAETSEAPTATETPTPDFSGTDFSGSWYVSEIIDSNGMPVTDAEKQIMEAGFTLELLTSGTYFVYGDDGMALGQGTYSVSLNQLILSADNMETVYEIVDENTMRITEPDTSVTVMKRQVEDLAEEGDPITDDSTGDTADSDTEGSDTAESEPASDASPTTEPALTDDATAETTPTDAAATTVAE